MNYTGTAKVPARQGGLTNLVAGLSGATFANGKPAFPFVLSGMVDNPRFILKTTKGVLSGFSTGPASGDKQGQQPSNPIHNLIIFSTKRRSLSRRSRIVSGSKVSAIRTRGADAHCKYRQGEHGRVVLCDDSHFAGVTNAPVAANNL